MSIGERIRDLREEKAWTQSKLGDMLDVSFQAVSSWERDEYLPDTEKLLKLSEIFGVSLSYLVEERIAAFETKKAIYDWKHMKTFVKSAAKAKELGDTLKALSFAEKAHEGQYRKNSDIPYIYHPLTLACHLLAMGIYEDDVIAAALLHDVIEDTEYEKEDLPVSEEAKKLVVLMSHPKGYEDREKMMKVYMKGLSEEPKAALLKCLDRCNNLTTMVYGLSRDRMVRMIHETEEYILPLLDKVKKTPRYNDAAWLLKYHIESMLDIYKRTL